MTKRKINTDEFKIILQNQNKNNINKLILLFHLHISYWQHTGTYTLSYTHTTLYAMAAVRKTA